MNEQGRGLVRLAILMTVLGGSASCADPQVAVHSAPQSAALAMAEQVRETALAYPTATVTDVKDNSGGVIACGLLRFEDQRPHVIYAIKKNDQWRVSIPYLQRQNSWNDPRNRTLSDAKVNLCAEFGITLPSG